MLLWASLVTPTRTVQIPGTYLEYTRMVLVCDNVKMTKRFVRTDHASNILVDTYDGIYDTYVWIQISGNRKR